MQPRAFQIIGTGNEFPEPPRHCQLKYIATIQEGSFVWHLFERLTTRTVPGSGIPRGDISKPNDKVADEEEI